jgi:hypothetical protein
VSEANGVGDASTSSSLSGDGQLTIRKNRLILTMAQSTFFNINVLREIYFYLSVVNITLYFQESKYKSAIPGEGRIFRNFEANVI